MTRGRSEEIRAAGAPEPQPAPAADTPPPPTPGPTAVQESGNENEPRRAAAPVRLRLAGVVPPEVWNRLGTKVVPRLRAGKGLVVEGKFEAEIPADALAAMEDALRRTLEDLELGDKVRLERR